MMRCNYKGFTLYIFLYQIENFLSIETLAWNSFVMLLVQKYVIHIFWSSISTLCPPSPTLATTSEVVSILRHMGKVDSSHHIFWKLSCKNRWLKNTHLHQIVHSREKDWIFHISAANECLHCLLNSWICTTSQYRILTRYMNHIYNIITINFQKLLPRGILTSVLLELSLTVLVDDFMRL